VIDEADRRALIGASAQMQRGPDGQEAGEGGTEGGGAIQRQRYTPADDQWITKEEALLQELRKDDEAKRMKLEVELPGSDEILIKVTPLPLCLFMALLAFKLILLARLLTRNLLHATSRPTTALYLYRAAFGCKIKNLRL
jgi:hypothetical protein